MESTVCSLLPLEGCSVRMKLWTNWQNVVGCFVGSFAVIRVAAGRRLLLEGDAASVHWHAWHTHMCAYKTSDWHKLLCLSLIFFLIFPGRECCGLWHASWSRCLASQSFIAHVTGWKFSNLLYLFWRIEIFRITYISADGLKFPNLPYLFCRHESFRSFYTSFSGFEISGLIPFHRRGVNQPYVADMNNESFCRKGVNLTDMTEMSDASLRRQGVNPPNITKMHNVSLDANIKMQVTFWNSNPCPYHKNKQVWSFQCWKIQHPFPFLHCRGLIISFLAQAGLTLQNCETHSLPIGTVVS